MRILIVQESDWLKRNMHQQHHLAELLSLRGHEIRAIDYEIMRNNRELKRQEFKDVKKIYGGAKITVVRPAIIKVIGLDYLSLLWTHGREIEKQMKEFKPDVVVGFSILNSYLAMKACKKYKVPFVYYWIDVLHELIPIAFLRNLGKAIEMRILKHADKVLVINKKLKTYVIGLGAKNVEVLSAGVNLKIFDCNIDGNRIRNLYGVYDRNVLLLYIGWLYKFSGLSEIIIRMAELKKQRIQLMVVGDGDDFNNLSSLRDKYGLQNEVILVGKKPYSEIPSFISASDICILPAYNNKIMENIVPIKVYEYLAMCKTVIATELPAIKEEFGDAVVYVKKPESVVDEVANYIDDMKHWCGCFVNIKSWDEIVGRFEEILNEVINAKLSARI
jgi:glycosyltransferase involved in cell wall biosynthesis